MPFPDPAFLLSFDLALHSFSPLRTAPADCPCGLFLYAFGYFLSLPARYRLSISPGAAPPAITLFPILDFPGYCVLSPGTSYLGTLPGSLPACLILPISPVLRTCNHFSFVFRPLRLFSFLPVCSYSFLFPPILFLFISYYFSLFLFISYSIPYIKRRRGRAVTYILKGIWSYG